MTNYYRITAYNEEINTSIIMDSYGRFEKLWQFSKDLMDKGFEIIEVSNDERFLDINIKKLDEEDNKYILRALQSGRPKQTTRTLNGTTYKAIQVNDKIYIPNKENVI